MLIGKVGGIVVFMAIHATKGCEISGRGVAFCALVPFSVVFSTKNREIKLVVLAKIGRLPAHRDRVASVAIGRKTARLVVWARRRLKIRCVASETLGRRARINAADMAFCAIADIVAASQWEKLVVRAAARPLPSRGREIMAAHAVGRIARRGVVRHRRGLIIRVVAIDAIAPDAIKTEGRFRAVAVGTIGKTMVAEQRKTIVKMQFQKIIDEPTIGRMAARAVVSEGHLVEIGVARNAIRARFFKNEGLVAGPAIDVFMLANEHKTGFFMVKTRRGGDHRRRGRHFLPLFDGDFPTFWRMTGGAIDRHRLAVRAL